MKLDRTILRSRVGRRIFGLFVVCAIVPIGAVAALSFGLVTTQLEEQSQRRLHQAARIVGLAIYERLVFLDAEAERFLLRRSLEAAAEATAGLHDELTRRFVFLALTGATGTQPVFGSLSEPVELTPAEREGLGSGKAVIVTRTPEDRPAQVFLAKAAGKGAGAPVLIAQVDTRYLWGSTEGVPLPALTELCVLNPAGQVLVCTVPLSRAGLERATRREVRSTQGQFEWSDGEEKYLASAWPIFMPSRFASAPWTVVVSESKRDVLAGLAYFRMVFPLVVLLSLWAVILLSVSLIRRNLVPLERLQEGTRRIAERRFDSRVSVTSGDEFEELAGSFNSMAHQLGRQFHALGTMAEITQVVLSSLESRRVIETVLARLRDVCPCDRAAVILAPGRRGETARMYLGDSTGVRSMLDEPVQLDTDGLPAPGQGRVVFEQPGLPACLAPLAARGMRSCAVLPIFLATRLSAMIVLGYRDGVTASEEDLGQARQLADQVAVALANARLVEELEELNWGTLHALARAIDAKSSWTAGHSERVTALALRLGGAMGLNNSQLAILQRGGLLHDIGKIGTPAEILDKPGRLTDEELRVMREHAAVGALILEPIGAYAEAIPVVREHHEWFDGRGYPQGLAGEAISLGARIFAVADVYDALSSDRPYRPGLERDKVMAYIRERSGSQFDPRVVEAFLQVMAEPEGREGETRAAAPPA